MSSSRLSKRHSFNQRVYNPRPVFRYQNWNSRNSGAVCTGRIRTVGAIAFIYSPPECVLSPPPPLSLPILFDLKVFRSPSLRFAIDTPGFAEYTVLEQFRKLKTNFCGESVKSRIRKSLFKQRLNAPISLSYY